jgi:hypothetical protein
MVVLRLEKMLVLLWYHCWKTSMGEYVRFRSFFMINFKGFLYKGKRTVGFHDYCIVPSPHAQTLEDMQSFCIIITIVCRSYEGLCIMSCCHFEILLWEGIVIVSLAVHTSNLTPTLSAPGFVSPSNTYGKVINLNPDSKSCLIVLTQPLED